MYRRWISAVAVSVLCCGLAAGPALAAAKTPSLWSLCKTAAKKESVPDSEKIQKCTAVIDAAAKGDKKAAKHLAAARFHRGVAYNRIDDHDKALADLDQAVTLKPKFSRAWYQRGNVYSDKGMFDQAIADYDRVLGLKPKHARALANRCRARALAAKELAKALADCNQSLTLRPKGNARALGARGLVYFRNGEFDKALSDLNAAIITLPKSASSLYVRGVVKLKKGDTTGGNADLAAAKALDGGLAGRYSALGVAP